MSPAGNSRECSGSLHRVANEAQMLRHIRDALLRRAHTCRSRSMKPSHPMWPRVEHAHSLIARAQYSQVLCATKSRTTRVPHPCPASLAGQGGVFDFLQASPPYFDELETAGTETLINTTWQNSESSY